MLTEKDIDKQIENEVEKFNTATYQGDVPQVFIEFFKKAIMHIPLAQHGVGVERIKVMISRKPDDVPYIEVGVMINFIFATPFHLIYSSIEEAIEMTEKFERVKNEYNKITAEFEVSMTKKKNALMRVAGLTKETVRLKSNLVMAGK